MSKSLKECYKTARAVVGSEFYRRQSKSKVFVSKDTDIGSSIIKAAFRGEEIPSEQEAEDLFYSEDFRNTLLEPSFKEAFKLNAMLLYTVITEAVRDYSLNGNRLLRPAAKAVVDVNDYVYEAFSELGIIDRIYYGNDVTPLNTPNKH